jgi:endoglucanase
MMLSTTRVASSASRHVATPIRLCPRSARLAIARRTAVVSEAVAYEDLEFFAKPDGIYASDNQKVQLRGINWFGCEMEDHCPHGLWVQNMDALFDVLQDNKFNAVRFTFSADFALGIDNLHCTSTGSNPEMNAWTAGQMLDHVVEECRKRGILVMLCMYCLQSKRQGQGPEAIPELWYDNNYPEGKVIEAWKRIAGRYANTPHVFAFDLKNEPHDAATWAVGNGHTDWAKAVERIGNAVHEVNPKALIFAEGIQRRADNGSSFWGGCLDGLRRYVPRLLKADKLVFSPHVYGPAQSPGMDDFKHADFPRNMPAIWERDWGFCANTIGPLVVGEWGGRDEVGSKDHTWHEALIQYLASLGCSSNFYWALNANAGSDTGGLLLDDWKTVDMNKMEHIKKLCPEPTRMDFASAAAF